MTTENENENTNVNYSLQIMGLISFSQQLIIGGFSILISYTVIILNYMNDY